MSQNETSSAYRALEIILGLVALSIGVLALVFPTAIFVTLVVFFGIALIIVGILRLATAASSDWLMQAIRKINAVIGILAIIFGVIILFVPLFATEVLIILIGFGLLIYGIGRIVVGTTAGRYLSGGLRVFLILAGVLIVVFSLITIFFPVVGIITYAVFVSLAFILIGIDSLATGIAGVKIV